MSVKPGLKDLPCLTGSFIFENNFEHELSAECNSTCNNDRQSDKDYNYIKLVVVVPSVTMRQFEVYDKVWTYFEV